MSCSKNDEEKKTPHLRLGNVLQLPSRLIPRRWSRSGTNYVIFLEALCAQTNLLRGVTALTKTVSGEKQIYSGNLEILPGKGKPGKFFGKFEIHVSNTPTRSGCPPSDVENHLEGITAWHEIEECCDFFDNDHD